MLTARAAGGATRCSVDQPSFITPAPFSQGDAAWDASWALLSLQRWWVPTQPHQAAPEEFGIGERYFPSSKFARRYSCDVGTEIKPLRARVEFQQLLPRWK